MERKFVFDEYDLGHGCDGVLALTVGGGDPVVARLEVRVLLAEGFPVTQKNRGSALRGFAGDVQIVHAARILSGTAVPAVLV